MNLFLKAIRISSVAFLSLLLLAGCGERTSFETVAETDDPVFRRARDLYARGMENEALENFLRLIQKRNGVAPESHLDAGNIYLKHLRDPVSAIYHFKRYEALLLRSDLPDASTRVDLVRDLIKSATKEFARTFDAKVYQDPLERLKLLDTVQMLRSENELLKRQLLETRTRLANTVGQQAEQSGIADRPTSEQEPIRVAPRQPVASTAANPAPVASPPVQRSYTIKAGDSLYKIARQVYGDSSRWREILAANRDRIPDETNLQVGTTIRIP